MDANWRVRRVLEHSIALLRIEQAIAYKRRPGAPALHKHLKALKQMKAQGHANNCAISGTGHCSCGLPEIEEILEILAGPASIVDVGEVIATS